MARRSIGSEEIERLRRTAQEVFSARPEVVAAWLFGSAARGAPARDLDVAVLLRSGVPAGRWRSEVAGALESGAGLDREVDLRPLAGTSPRFRVTVLREGVLLYEADRGARVRFEAQAMSEWAEFRPVWLRLRAAMLARWADG